MILDLFLETLRYLPLLIPVTLLLLIANVAHFSATNKDSNALFPLALAAFVFVFMPLAVFLSE